MIYSKFHFHVRESFLKQHLYLALANLVFFFVLLICDNGSVCIFGIGTDGDCPKKYFSLKATSYDPNLWESTYLGQLFVNSHIKQSHFSVQTRPNEQIHSFTVSYYKEVLNFLCAIIKIIQLKCKTGYGSFRYICEFFMCIGHAHCLVTYYTADLC